LGRRAFQTLASPKGQKMGLKANVIYCRCPKAIPRRVRRPRTDAEEENRPPETAAKAQKCCTRARDAAVHAPTGSTVTQTRDGRVPPRTLWPPPAGDHMGVARRIFFGHSDSFLDEHLAGAVGQPRVRAGWSGGSHDPIIQPPLGPSCPFVPSLRTPR